MNFICEVVNLVLYDVNDFHWLYQLYGFLSLRLSAMIIIIFVCIIVWVRSSAIANLKLMMIFNEIWNKCFFHWNFMWRSSFCNVICGFGLNTMVLIEIIELDWVLLFELQFDIKCNNTTEFIWIFTSFVYCICRSGFSALIFSSELKVSCVRFSVE